MPAARDPIPIPLIAPARRGSFTWLLHLRWMAVAGQLITILAAVFLADVKLPFIPLLVLVAITAVTNLLCVAWLYYTQSGRSTSGIVIQPPASAENPTTDPFAAEDDPTLLQSIALALMLLDLVTLTLMLYFSGGADNPFSFFYFVNLAVGGVMIRPRPAWSMTAFAIVGYMILLRFNVPVEGITIRQPATDFNLHTGGLLFAFSTCATVVTYYVTRTAGELQNRERELRRAQAAHAASHRLEGLTTLAAGAAHELATPLSTIDVIVRELSRHLEDCEKPQSVDTDLQLIDGQLEMCRQILARMRSAAGDAMAHRWDQTTVGDLIDATLEGIRDPHRVDVDDGSDRVENQELWVPREAVAQAIRNLIHNGLDASGCDGRVRVEATLDDQHLQLLVHDSGNGMTGDVLERAGEPFFTTKEPGRGIGLGLFLTRNVISQLGGDLNFESSPGHGTRAIVRLPLQQDDIRLHPNSMNESNTANPLSGVDPKLSDSKSG